MENVLFGILTLILSTLGYFNAWKQYKNRKYKLSLVYIIISAAPLYLFVATDFYLHTWDERYHALVAKNLLDHPLIPTLFDNPILPYDYKSWVSNHIWLHKQPLPLYLIAGSFKLFGINEIAVRIPSIVMSLISIWLTYHIARYFYDKKVGLLAAFFFSINGLIIELTGGRVATDHIDINFMFFVLLSIFLSIKYVRKRQPHYLILMSITISAAILTKWLAALIVMPIWMLMAMHEKSIPFKLLILNTLLISSIILLLVLPWQIYIFQTFPLEAAYEASFNYRHFTEVIEGRSGSIFYFLNKLRINYGELIYLPLLWFFWQLIKNKLNFKKLALLAWFLVPLLIFSFAKTKMQAYLLFTAPALFIVSSAFFFELKSYKSQVKYQWLLNTILLLLILLPVRYSIERMKPFSLVERNPQWVRELKELQKEKIKKGILFNYHSPIEVMFYTDLDAYSYIPENEKILELRDEGFEILINDYNLPDRILSIDGVKIRKLSDK